MADANKRLSSGLLNENFSVDLSDEIREMYFGEVNLSDRVKDYTELALAVIEAKDQSSSVKIVNQFDQLAEPLLEDLNRVVSQYQKEGEARLEFIETLEFGVWLFTLFALFLEVLFIFRPMARKVVESAEQEQRTVDNMQNLIELRTLKLEQANQKLLHMASHDPLTGVKNRLTLEVDIEKLIEAFHKNQQDFALALVDIDWFKQVNDTYGHVVGDTVIKKFAQLLTDHVRDSDAVYRVGGEEFVLLFNRIDLSELVLKLEQLREMIQDHPFHYQDQEIPVTASFGVFHSSRFDSIDYHQILSGADSALYQSKQNGRNQVTVAE